MTLITSLTERLDPEDRERVRIRLAGNLMAWLTTVRPDGRPDTVPVWFLLREDGTIRVYTKPGQRKLRNLAENPHVSFVLDVSDIGRNVVRLSGTAVVDADAGPAAEDATYLGKYTERIAALFDKPEAFSEAYSVALTITPDRIML